MTYKQYSDSRLVTQIDDLSNELYVIASNLRYAIDDAIYAEDLCDAQTSWFPAGKCECRECCESRSTEQYSPDSISLSIDKNIDKEMESYIKDNEVCREVFFKELQSMDDTLVKLLDLRDSLGAAIDVPFKRVK